MPSLVLTLLGPDRPGLVDAVATIVKEQKANWLESRMSHLAGHFAGIVRVEVEQDGIDPLIKKLEGLEEKGLSIVARHDQTESVDDVTVVWMELVGNDRPGIVSELSRVFAEKQVNVEEFQTELQGAPNSGAALFRAHAGLKLPTELSIDDLQKALEGIAADLMVDITLAPDDR